MKDLKLTAIALTTTALIASNLVISKQYINDTKEYERKIKVQEQIIEQYKINELHNKQQIKKEQLNINNLNSQLNQLKKDNNKLKKELVKESEMRKLTVQASAYISGCPGCSGRTFSGVSVDNTIEYNGYKVIAADLSILPLYSIVQINIKNNSFKAIVIDTGGDIKGYKIDLLVGSYEDAIEFGKQMALIKVLREGK